MSNKSLRKLCRLKKIQPSARPLLSRLAAVRTVREIDGGAKVSWSFSHVWAPHVLCSMNANTGTHAVSIRDTSDPSVPSLPVELKGSFITSHLVILTGL